MSVLFLFCPAFPSDPVLKDPGPTLLGQEVLLHCDVINVFSANQLRIRWQLGNTSLTSELSGFSGSLKNVSSVLQHRALEDQQFLTCTAELLTENGDAWRTRRTSIPLQVHCEFLSKPDSGSERGTGLI